MTALYRIFDATGRLIYVGSTRGLSQRIAEHERRAWWADQIATVESVPFDTYAEASAAESSAIATENPRWNVKGRWAHRSGWTADDYADYRLAFQAQGNSRTRAGLIHLANIDRAATSLGASLKESA